jgi:hypothetical protein
MSSITTPPWDAATAHSRRNSCSVPNWASIWVLIRSNWPSTVGVASQPERPPARFTGPVCTAEIPIASKVAHKESRSHASDRGPRTGSASGRRHSTSGPRPHWRRRASTPPRAIRHTGPAASHPRPRCLLPVPPSARPVRRSSMDPLPGHRTVHTTSHLGRQRRPDLRSAPPRSASVARSPSRPPLWTSTCGSVYHNRDSATWDDLACDG